MGKEFGWNAFCMVHFEEALQYVKEKYKDCQVGWTEMFEAAEPTDEDLTCGYPKCKNVATREIYWMRLDVFTKSKSKLWKPHLICRRCGATIKRKNNKYSLCDDCWEHEFISDEE